MPTTTATAAASAALGTAATGSAGVLSASGSAAASAAPTTAAVTAAAMSTAATAAKATAASVDPAADAGSLISLFSNFFNTVGAEWVLWILLVLSVVSVGLMFDRWFYLRRRRADNDRLAKDLDRALTDEGPEKAAEVARAAPSLAGTAMAEALRHYGHGPRSVEEAVAGVIARERAKFGRGLGFLGTLGNNAPFIGLFGTVLGIIRAFADLARFGAAAGASAVMVGIAEALVATAVGLLVAIPAVMSFNYFQSRIKAEVMQATAMTHVLLARMLAERPDLEREGTQSLGVARSVRAAP